MRRSSAAEAIICSFQSRRRIVARKGARDAAAAWVRAAIAAGCDPHMWQESLSGDGLAGEWFLVTSKAGLNHPRYPGKLPDEFLDEVFIVLARLERVLHDTKLKAWHGNVLPDDSSARALALRMKLARQSLAMDRGRFYGACGMNLKAGEALEAGRLAFASPDNEMMHGVCAHHNIPEEWLMFGEAEDIDA